MFELGERIYNFATRLRNAIPGLQRAHFLLNTESNMGYVAESMRGFVAERNSGGGAQVHMSCFSTTTAAGTPRVGTLTTNATKVDQANTLSRMLIDERIRFHSSFDAVTLSHKGKGMRAYIHDQMLNYGRRDVVTARDMCQGVVRTTTTFGPIDDDIKDDAVMALGILVGQIKTIYANNGPAISGYASLRRPLTLI